MILDTIRIDSYKLRDGDSDGFVLDDGEKNMWLPWEMVEELVRVRTLLRDAGTLPYFTNGRGFDR